MRLSTRTWALISAACFIAAIVFWRLGDKRLEDRRATQEKAAASAVEKSQSPPSVGPSSQAVPVVFPKNLITTAAPAPVSTAETNHATFYRLRNTPLRAGELARNDKALLLRNAFIDTAKEEAIAIPEHLRAEGDPGSYIVQADGKADDAFRAMLARAGAEIVAYVPNNAYLVRVAGVNAEKLAGSPKVQSVVPYEPYFKIDLAVMPFAIDDKPLEAGAKFRLMLFPGELESVEQAVVGLGVRVLDKGRSPFGPELVVQPMTGQLAALAQLPGVQNIEFLYARGPANDLARVRMGISADTVVATNFLGLSGTNIYVNVNDSGVDVTHPDLENRVLVGTDTLATDADGHGTHVAGIIASSGASGPTNAPPGSVPGANFRGMAHNSTILSFDFLNHPDWHLQEFPARTNIMLGKTNALISNNSWSYIGAYGYDTAAASFDAAVRDAIPDMTGPQPMLFVFASGNDGGGNEAGSGGFPESISSPATAKNVITVGAIESYRRITNEVIRPNGSGVTITNADFLGSTDSSNEVVSFSSRGNVEIGTEGDWGRFKPDVVAPGSFIVSTRSSQWDTNAYYNPTNVHPNFFTNLVIGAGQTNSFSIFLPENVVGLILTTFPDGVPPLAFYTNAVRRPSTNASNFAGTNYVEAVVGDPGLLRDERLYYDIVNTNTFSVTYDLITAIFTTNDFGNYLEVLQGLNENLGNGDGVPKYRYESGTSMAAPVVSGMLALLQEYFEKQSEEDPDKAVNPSPALMKALLINSSRAAGGLYDLQMQNNINFQGWGLPNLQGMLPQDNSILFFDQSPTNSLATDEKHVREITVSSNALSSTLRVSLVWTDPPGNPAVGVKLVNDLDLIVTNLTTGDVYFGNHFQGGSEFSSINILTETNGSNVVLNGEHDVINNVENVYLNGPLDSTYSVAVVGRRVNVNAVTAQTNAIKQDYALVISIGDLTITNALAATNVTVLPNIQTNLTTMTNLESAVPGQGFSLAFLPEERVGANNPFENSTNGTLNQWSFYRFTNTFGYTNVAFAVFGAANLSGVSTGGEWQLPGLRNVEADVDLYASNDPDLLSLNTTALALAHKSLDRGGNEIIILTNEPATAGNVYYIGVKSEDQRAAEYGIIAIASELPFSSTDGLGNMLPIFFPVPRDIEDGSPDDPGRTDLFGIMVQDVAIRRLMVSNSFEHQEFGDLVGVLRKRGLNTSVILNNHGFPNGQINGIVSTLYNDMDEGDTPGAHHSDGPGSLINFMGERARGLWNFTVSDNALTHTGRVLRFNMYVDPLPEDDAFNGGTELIGREICRDLFAGSRRYHVVNVPRGATNLTVFADFLAGGPLEVYIRRGTLPTLTEYDHKADLAAPGGTVEVTQFDSPPLQPGRYYIMFYNPTASQFQLCWHTRIRLGTSGNPPIVIATNNLPPVDDAVANSIIHVSQTGLVSDVQVGVRIDHPRVADLSLRLVSPRGTRVLLFENRGGNIITGLGATNDLEQTNVFAVFTEKTNFFPDLIKFAQPPFGSNIISATTTTVFTNDFEIAPGVVAPPGPVEDWTVDSAQVSVVADALQAYSGTNFVRLEQEPDSDPAVLGGISRTFPTIPGQRYTVRLFYRTPITASNTTPVSITVNGVNSVLNAENRWTQFGTGFNATAANATITIASVIDPVLIDAVEVVQLGGGQYYLPEESLRILTGEQCRGDWTLQVWDTRLEAPVPASAFQWRLELDLINDTPLPTVTVLTNGVPYVGNLNNTNGFRYFMVQAPLSATVATNMLTSLSGNGMELWYNQNGLPTGGTPAVGDYQLFTTAGTGENRAELINALPSPYFIPGQRYYLGVRNVNPADNNNFIIKVEFDQTNSAPLNLLELTNAIAYSTNIAPGLAMQYYQFQVTNDAVSANFELFGLNGDVDLFIRRGAPLPTYSSFHYSSQKGGTANESIIVSTNTAPVPLTPGIWYIGVLNRTANPVNYSVRVTESFAADINIINLTAGVPTNAVAEVGPNITNYYRLVIDQTNSSALFEIFNLSGDGDLMVRYGALPTTSDIETIMDPRGGTTPEQIVVTSNAYPPTLNGEWYLAVVNNEATDITFTIHASVSTNGVLPSALLELTNAIAYSTNIAPSPTMHYYQFQVTNDAVSAAFELFGLDGDVDLFLRMGAPLPSLSNYDYSSEKVGTDDETIIVSTNSAPVPLTPGVWYIGVLNRSANPVNYSVRVTETVTPSINIMDLTAGVPTNGVARAGSIITNYYRLIIDQTNASAIFELFDLSGNGDLIVRQGALPSISNNETLWGDNAGTTPEQIVVTTNASRPSLNSEWYVAVVNNAQVDITFTIHASVSTNGVLPSGQPIRIISGPIFDQENVTIEFTTIPGQFYEVQASSDLVTWTPVGPAVEGYDSVYVYVFPANEEAMQFYRVRQVPPPPAP